MVDAIDAIDESEKPQEDKLNKIIKLLHSKGLGVEFKLQFGVVAY